MAGSVAFLVGAVCGCGGGGSASDNGVASKSANGIIQAASKALEGASSVHVSGTTTSGGSPVSFNLDLVNGKGGRGSMSVTGLSFQIITIGNTVYIKGSDTFWSHFGGSAAVQLFHNKWLKAPASGNFASFADLTNLHALFTRLLASHGALSKGSTTTINGQKAIAITDASKGGTLYVATTGAPYPVEVSRSGSGGGKIGFSRFNASVSLTAPANAIDITQLKR